MAKILSRPNFMDLRRKLWFRERRGLVLVAWRRLAGVWTFHAVGLYQIGVVIDVIVFVFWLYFGLGANNAFDDTDRYIAQGCYW